MKIIPINLDNLIHARSVESVRREFKKSWSEQTLEQIIRTICAFANDFLNLNGGYLVIGVEEQDGAPVLPPHGLAGENLDEIQKAIRGNCKRLDPEYQPIFSPELYQGRQILVIWAPAGDVRPYQAPKTQHGNERAYYVRLGSETVEAKGDILTQLMQLTAKVPFDDRRNTSVTMDMISPAFVRNYLAEIKSDLLSSQPPLSEIELYRKLRISAQVNEHDLPRNVALMFFTNDPSEYFPGARIEVVQFADDAGGDLIEEKIFRGPLHVQLRQAVDFLNSFSPTMIEKVPEKPEAQRTVAYPYGAMEEAVVNAVYHRGYENAYEPIKVYLYPDRMEVTSYPGPRFGLELHHFEPGSKMPAIPNRNRRIGEFLKELELAEGRGTGIPKILRKMKENGSPQPVFDFDKARTYFRVTLPAHPKYIEINALRESARLWAVGDENRAIGILEDAVSKAPQSGALLAQLIEYNMTLGRTAEAENLFKDAGRNSNLKGRRLISAAMKRTANKKAWAWFNIARALAWLRAPDSEVLQAYSKAVELLPEENKFNEWLSHWNESKRKYRKG